MPCSSCIALQGQGVGVSEGTGKELDLEKILAHQDEGILYQMTKIFSKEEYAKELFQDVKRFLYLCASLKRSLAPPEFIDQGWHLFILCTESYQRFCFEYFGGLIHHRPDGPAEKCGGEPTGQETYELASSTFGELSPNWAVTHGQVRSRCSSDCTSS